MLDMFESLTLALHGCPANLVGRLAGEMRCVPSWLIAGCYQLCRQDVVAASHQVGSLRSLIINRL